MSIRKLLVGVLGLAVLILNPFYACGALDPEYTYSAADMKAAVEGTWTLTLEGQSYIFHIKQGTAEPSQRHSSRSLIPSAHACGKRWIVASAGACEDLSEMPIVVELTGETRDGRFVVFGMTFREGDLYIEVADHEIHAVVTPDGKATVKDGKLVRTAR